MTTDESLLSPLLSRRRLCVSGRYPFASESFVYLRQPTAPGDRARACPRDFFTVAHDFDCAIDPPGSRRVSARVLTNGARVVVGPSPVVAALYVCVSVTVDGLQTQAFRQIVHTLDTGPAGGRPWEGTGASRCSGSMTNVTSVAHICTRLAGPG